MGGGKNGSVGQNGSFALISSSAANYLPYEAGLPHVFRVALEL